MNIIDTQTKVVSLILSAIYLGGFTFLYNAIDNNHAEMMKRFDSLKEMAWTNKEAIALTGQSLEQLTNRCNRIEKDCDKFKTAFIKLETKSENN